MTGRCDIELCGGSSTEEEGNSTESCDNPEWESDSSRDPDDFGKGKGAGADYDGGIFAPHRRWACIGYLAQYFSVGVIYGGLPATVYGVFLGYLCVPSYVYATVGVVMTLPWSFKFLFGLVNDTVPICGQRRRPYMVIGWAFCACMLLVLAAKPLPPPYWCIDPDTGEYIKEVTGPDGERQAATPCHPDAKKMGGEYALLMMLAALGYVVADVAADGLTVEYAKLEPIDKRGTTQTSAYLTRTIGQVFSSLFVGIGMNGKLYNGSFDQSLSFNNICLGFAVPAFLMVPISMFFITEPTGKVEGRCSEYLGKSWQLLCNKAFMFVLLYHFLSGAIGGVQTTAGGLVKNEWAGVKNLQNQMFSLGGNLLFAWGLWLVKRNFLNKSWRVMLMVTTIFLNVIDSVFTTLTVFNVVRNQYFYLGETVLVEVPAAANFVVSTFVVVEMADDGNEGLVYGLLTTAGNLGGPVSQAIANQLFGLFTPNLSDVKNYIKDTPDFRITVFISFAISYGFSFLALVFLFFLPNQKQEAQLRKATWPRRRIFGAIAVTLLCMGVSYTVLVDVLSMLPRTMCMKLAGGAGCNAAEGY